MAVTPASVVETAPELASEDPARIQRFIDIAKPYVNLNTWGAAKYDYALELFTAHLLTTALTSTTTGGSSGGGLVTSEKVGDLSIGYAVAAAAPDTLATTKYGSLFLQLRRTLLITPIVVT